MRELTRAESEEVIADLRDRAITVSYAASGSHTDAMEWGSNPGQALHGEIDDDIHGEAADAALTAVADEFDRLADIQEAYATALRRRADVLEEALYHGDGEVSRRD